MKWSKTRQQLLGKLQEIERARRSGAEARLASARAQSSEAEAARDEAGAALVSAERAWSDRHSGKALDLELARLLAGDLLTRERDRDERQLRLAEAEEHEESERAAWRGLEARVRAGDHVMKRGRRLLARQEEARRDQALSDRTTWRWFQR